jgi:type IX secretion system PorP/SprF family membrane protein
MRIFSIILFCLALFASVKGQEKALLYSHYTYNGLAINPAYAGSHDMLSVSVSHRSQWMGFEGAPAYNILGVHAPYKDTKMGLGLLVMNESMGLRKYTGIYLNYAHRITLGRGKLALGLKAGLGTGKFEQTDLGDGDIIFSKNTSSFLLPNFGVGAYYYSKKFYAGLSIPLLLGYKTTETGEVTVYHDFKKYAYYLTAGVNIDIAQNWQVKPSALVEYDKAGGVIADVGVGLLYREAYSVGISYRSKQAIVMLLDYKVTNQLRVGIAYDYGISALNSYNRSSMEIALEYNFGYKIKASNPTIF